MFRVRRAREKECSSSPVAVSQVRTVLSTPRLKSPNWCTFRLNIGLELYILVYQYTCNRERHSHSRPHNWLCQHGLWRCGEHGLFGHPKVLPYYPLTHYGLPIESQERKFRKLFAKVLPCNNVVFNCNRGDVLFMPDQGMTVSALLAIPHSHRAIDPSRDNQAGEWNKLANRLTWNWK